MESHPRNHYSSGKVTSKSCELHQHQWSLAFTGPSQNLQNTSKTLRKPWVEPSRGPIEPSRDRKVTQGSGKGDPETMKSHPRNEYSSEKVISKSSQSLRTSAVSRRPAEGGGGNLPITCKDSLICPRLQATSRRSAADYLVFCIIITGIIIIVGAVSPSVFFTQTGALGKNATHNSEAG